MRKIRTFFWYQNLWKFEKNLKQSDRAPLTFSFRMKTEITNDKVTNKPYTYQHYYDSNSLCPCNENEVYKPIFIYLHWIGWWTNIHSELKITWFCQSISILFFYSYKPYESIQRCLDIFYFFIFIGKWQKQWRWSNLSFHVLVGSSTFGLF